MQVRIQFETNVHQTNDVTPTESNKTSPIPAADTRLNDVPALFLVFVFVSEPVFPVGSGPVPVPELELESLPEGDELPVFDGVGAGGAGALVETGGDGGDDGALVDTGGDGGTLVVTGGGGGGALVVTGGGGGGALVVTGGGGGGVLVATGTTASASFFPLNTATKSAGANSGGMLAIV